MASCLSMPLAALSLGVDMVDHARQARRTQEQQQRGGKGEEKRGQGKRAVDHKGSEEAKVSGHTS